MFHNLWIISELILPQNLMEKYAEKLYLEYLLKNFGEKNRSYDICNMFCIPIQNPDGENRDMT